MSAGPDVPEGGERMFVGLGANLGEARQTVLRALDDLTRLPETCRVACSALYRSAPVDAIGPDFVNAVAELRTGLSPMALLQALQAIEQASGRQRPYRNAPRTLDLDLLLFGQRQMADPELTLPHPRLHLRAFVLRPLLDLAPDLRHPVLGVLQPFLGALADQSLQRLEDPPAGDRVARQRGSRPPATG